MKILIIPAYNEGSQVGEVVRSVLSKVDKVIVVDDGSVDATSEEATLAGAITLRHAVNRGYGAALQTGQVLALELGATVIIHFDADGQFLADDIEKVIAPIENKQADVVLGSRFLGNVENIPSLRKFILKLGIVFTWVFSGIKLTDAHNGFRAVSASALTRMDFIHDEMAFSSEFIDEVARLKLRWVEVPVTVRYTDYSIKSSKQGRMPALKIVKDLILGKFIK